MFPQRLFSIRFQGYRDNPHRWRMRPLGCLKLPVKVLSFPPDTFSPAPERRNSENNHPVRLPDQSVAYIRHHSYKWTDFYLPDRGAYVLNKLLGLKLIPRTDIVSLGKAFFNPISPIGTIQEAVEGITGHQFFLQAGKQLSNPDDLAALYLYTVIAFDTDKAPRNVIITHRDGRLKSIDNEFAGGDDTASQARFLFPVELSNEPIPEKYLAKVKRFLARETRNRQILSPFFPARTMDRMFLRARFILDHPVMMPIDEVADRLHQQWLESRPENLAE